MRVIIFWVIMFFFIISSQASTSSSDSSDISSEQRGASEYSQDNPYTAENERELGEDLGLSEDSLSYEMGSMPGVEHMEHKMARPEKHQIPEIKLSKFEWVATSQKGYGLAAGITLLAGVSFVILNIRRSI